MSTPSLYKAGISSLDITFATYIFIKYYIKGLVSPSLFSIISFICKDTKEYLNELCYDNEK